MFAAIEAHQLRTRSKIPEAALKQVVMQLHPESFMLVHVWYQFLSYMVYIRYMTMPALYEKAQAPESDVQTLSSILIPVLYLR